MKVIRKTCVSLFILAFFCWTVTKGPESVATFQLTILILGDSKNEQLYFNRGQLRQAYGNHAGALVDFDKVVAIVSDSESSSIELASAYFQRGQASEFVARSPFTDKQSSRKYYISAIADFEKSMELHEEGDEFPAGNLALRSANQVRKKTIRYGARSMRGTTYNY